ncbi:hypothetical protein [Motilimonas sp. KMU-193]|uniref:hypothetical protein n=1 Tax=Motilimonas sp. KMU-193 TaxID=3388668 RepID=UPI00396B2F07
MKNLLITAGLLTMALPTHLQASEADVKEIYRAPWAHPPLVLPNGSMISIVEHRRAAYDYVLKLNFLDASGQQLNSVIYDSDDAERWVSAAPSGDVWFFDNAGNLMSWNAATQQQFKLPLLANDANTRAVVTTDNQLVIFNSSEQKLIKYSASLTSEDSLAYASCVANLGYFTCQDTDGNTEYVDANTFSVYADNTSFVEIQKQHIVTTDDSQVITIKDQSGNTLFSRLVVNAPLLNVVTSDSHIALLYPDGNKKRLVLVDWDGTVLIDTSEIVADNLMAFHPSGYLMWGNWKTHFLFKVEGLRMSSFSGFDYLASNNPQLINGYDIVPTDYNGSPSDNTSPDIPKDDNLMDIPTDDTKDELSTEPEANVSNTKGGGGSSTPFALLSLLGLVLLRKFKLA